MRRKRRSSVDLGVIFSGITNRRTKVKRLSTIYKELGLDYRSPIDGIWTTKPDGTTTFEWVTLEDKVPDYILKGARLGFITITERRKSA